jgi:hypothetical protein
VFIRENPYICGSSDRSKRSAFVYPNRKISFANLGFLRVDEDAYRVGLDLRRYADMDLRVERQDRITPRSCDEDSQYDPMFIHKLFYNLIECGQEIEGWIKAP